MTSTRSRIGLSAHLLSLSEDYRGAGINRYIYGLLTHLPAAAPHLAFTAFVADRRLADDPPDGLALAFPRWPTQSRRAARIAWEQVAQPLALRREGVDLVHGLAYALPAVRGARSVVTVHDLTVFLYPDAFNRTNRLYVATITRESVRRADAIIADSANTRADIIRLLGVAPDKVVAIPLGIDEQYRPAPPAEIEALRQRYGLPPCFILYLGTLEPRKNYPRLIRAFAQLRRQSGLAHTLVIGGGKGWLTESLFALAEQEKVASFVRFLGYVDEADLPALYSLADLYAFPSRYEGFGIPVVEAMACGTPVVCADNSSLPEAAGAAAILVNADDTDALAAALERGLTDQAWRAAARRLGQAQAARFSWRASAAQLVAAYAKAGQERSR
ncbi:MAG: glycosyltransferase family 4 protein [Anaerolineae bacterium]|nr:glycosyltransferase family 4 protein [Anaerolineae bacterium]